MLGPGARISSQTPKQESIPEQEPRPAVTHDPAEPPNGKPHPKILPRPANRLASQMVDEKGMPRNIRVVRPLGLGLDEKAIEAVQRWRFKPGMKDGHAVATEATVEVNFRLLESGRTPSALVAAHS